MIAPALRESTDRLPEAVRRYLDRAIAPGAASAREVRLRMHGEIRLRDWSPFEAEETIRAGRDLRWDARAKVRGLPVVGYDELVRGFGKSAWKLFGRLPLAFAHGADVSRSAVGRMAAESVWLPSSLLGKDVTWTSAGPDEATFTIRLFGHKVEVTLGLSSTGAVETIRMMRWGNPDGQPFGFYPFGGIVEESRTFGEFTIPSRLRLGWHFGPDGFRAEGESFRVTLDDAVFAV